MEQNAQSAPGASRARWILFTIVVVLTGALASRVITNTFGWVSDTNFWSAGRGFAVALILAYWILMLTLVAAERRWPAEPKAGTLTNGGAVDFIWLLMTPLALALVALYVGVLGWVADVPLAGAQLDLAGLIGPVPAAIAILLVVDFSVWISHIARHRVPLFWRFHSVHHSQTEMGVFTGYRRHFVEIIVTVTFVYIPARLLDISNEGAVLISTMVVLFNSFSHANLRINFGPLRWILVSPQSHRVHHSSEPRHFNRNYGAVLSIWDHFFRIAWHDKSEYPPTGILDPRFPLEERSRAITAIRFYLRQLVYPFTSLRQVQPKSQ